MQTPEFVPKSDVLDIHKRQIERFGGLDGIRDDGLLDSDLAQPQATFFGELLHPTISSQAAAYLYHLAKNHPFLDGNKRTAFATMIAFLSMNSYELNMTEEVAYNMVMQLAQSEMTKEELSSLLEQHILG
ncbi:MAG: type II toxin-antitoxin system death-on-curing family toxin [Gloeocapsa sp. UFS-A4-WI-NPMV-4B04]|nr:type II toxin-antitoxin system death-on-curing family toxin [Gloeocapsa sp. UFS-A4-WI-NPMV-4B04]